MLRNKVKKYMDIKNESGQAYEYNCSENILYAGNDYYNLELTRGDINSLNTFTGGMYPGDTCGVVTAGAVLIGSIFSEEDPKLNAQMEDVVQLWIHRFNEKFETTDCDQLRGLDEMGELASCNPLILEASDILETTIAEYLNENQVIRINL